jgi:hypothetical protein
MFNKNIPIKMTEKSFTGLKYIVNYNRILSISFYGVNFNEFKGKKDFVLDIILISWHILFIMIFAYHSYYNLNAAIIENLKKWNFNSSKSYVIIIVHTVGCFGFHIQAFVTRILLFLRGSKIINLLKSENLEYIEKRNERRIGLFIALTQFLTSIIFEFSANFFLYNPSVETLKFILDFLFYTSIFSSQLSTIALIAYKSLIVSKQLKNISDNFSQTNLENIYHFVCKTNLFIKDLDELFSSFISISIFSFTVISIAMISILAIDAKNYLTLSFILISESLIIITTLCLSCDIIPKSFNKFCDLLEKYVTKNSSGYQLLDQMNQNILLMKINSIKHEIGFTASNLFKISTNTIISCLALILSYSVVLIQTSSEN